VPITGGAGHHRPEPPVATVGRLVGTAGLLASAAIHLDLALAHGYDHVPTIGPLFLVTGAVGLVLAVALGGHPGPWTALVAAGFAAAVIAGYLASLLLPMGIFSFREPSVSGAGAGALVAEVAVVAAAALWIVPAARRHLARRPVAVAPASTDRVPAAGPGGGPP
jgi:hypothetical protein